MITLADIKSIQKTRLHGTSINKVPDFYTTAYDVATRIMAPMPIPETRKSVVLANPLFSHNQFFVSPEDVFEVINIYPLSDRQHGDVIEGRHSVDFENNRIDKTYTTKYVNGISLIGADFASLPVPIEFDACNDTTGWTVGDNNALGDNITDFRADNLNRVDGYGSLTGNIANSGAVSRVTVRFGNDNANYYEILATDNIFGPLKDGWNFTRHALRNAPKTGTVNLADMKYIRVTYLYNTTQEVYFEKTLTKAIDFSDSYLLDRGSVTVASYFDNVTNLTILNLDNILVQLGDLYVMDYYSKYAFVDKNGVWKIKPTEDTDKLVISNVIGEQIYNAELSLAIAQQVQGAMGEADKLTWKQILFGNPSATTQQEQQGLWHKYAGKAPSETAMKKSIYYNFYNDID